MNIEKIKEAITTGGSLVHPNPRNGTVMVMSPSLEDRDSVELSYEEYDVYCRATVLTTQEKLKRLGEILEDSKESNSQ